MLMHHSRLLSSSPSWPHWQVCSDFHLSPAVLGIERKETLAALEPDYATKLNNVLQGHPSGNLTPHFQYVMAFKPGGPDLQMAHHATAKCEFCFSVSPVDPIAGPHRAAVLSLII